MAILATVFGMLGRFAACGLAMVAVDVVLALVDRRRGA